MVQINWDVVKDRSKRVGCCMIPSFIRLLVTCAIVGLVAVVSVLKYNSPPWQFTTLNVNLNWTFDPRTMATFDANFTYNVLMDTHCHTTYSDGSLTPEQNIEWHISNGYNAMIVTDHNTIDGAFVAEKIAREKYNDQIKVIKGMEWTNCRCHLGLIGINQTITPIKYPTDLEIQQVINQTHALGGMVVYNHRPWAYWSGLDMPSVEDFANWGVDFFDVANTIYFDFQTLVFARSRGIRYVSANDYHSGGGGATGWTVFNIPNVNYSPDAPINASYFTADQLWETMKTAQTSFIYDVIGHGQNPFSLGGTNPKWVEWFPWIQAGAFFHSFYSMQRGVYSFVNGENCGSQKVTVQKDGIKSTVLWFLGLFIVGEIIRNIISFVVRRIRQRRQVKQEEEQKSGRYMKAWDNEFGVVDTPLLNMNL